MQHQVSKRTLPDEENKEMEFSGTSRTLQPCLWRVQDPISLAVTEVTLRIREQQALSLFVRVGEADMYRKLLTALHNFQRTICNVTHSFLEENRR
jgi:hypothetical protein